MDKALHKTILDILTHTSDMTIATVRPDGWPQATTVSYVSDGLSIFFVTGARAQKAQNIEKCGKVSLTVDRPYKDWEEITGLSLGGTAERVTDEDQIAKIETLMAKKFHRIADFSMPESALAFFKVTPSVISVLDYRKGFGHTDEVRV
jgi:general stress protein 26